MILTQKLHKQIFCAALFKIDKVVVFEKSRYFHLVGKGEQL